MVIGNHRRWKPPLPGIGRGERQPIGPTNVPILFIWGDADDTVCRPAAEGDPANSLLRITASKLSPMSAISPPSGSRNGTPRYCWIISPITRSDGGTAKSEPVRRCNCWILFELGEDRYQRGI